MKNNFNYDSIRAYEARLGIKIGKKSFEILSLIITIILLSSGIALLIFRHSFAFLCFSGSILAFMFYYWIKKELREVPVRQNLNGDLDINDILSKDFLSRLPRHPETINLARAAIQTPSVKFLAVRYSIHPKMIIDFAEHLPNDATPIFETAIKIYQKTHSQEIHGAIIALAIILSHPSSEVILKQMCLEVGDLLDGIIWFNYLNGLVSNLKKRTHSGGIARDLSFGYIPTLQKLGENISETRISSLKTQLHLSAQREVVSQITQIFSNHGRQNIVLIGEEGSGRSTAVQAFAEQLLDADSNLPKHLRFRQIFRLDASAIISATSHRGQIENLLAKIFDEAYSAKNIILWLKNAELFFEDGTGSIDISNIMLPILEAGKLRIIMTMNRQKFLEISDKKSALTNILNKILVEPANEQETMKVLQDQVPILEYQHHVTYNIWALKEAFRLSQRYIHDLEMPGRAISLLDSAGDFADPHNIITAESVQKAVEKTEGVKVCQSSDESMRSKLLNMEELIHQRMIDQQEAVKTVSDALRRAAAGVRNENRPIGTYLFLGPTGVGKTELAKAVSEVYFDGEKHIIRLDLNQFVSSADVSRLIADATQDELSLTAQVIKQPFAVVLLDEIEKAHPQVLTTLLQLLDEGILRDIKGREVSFRDTIVIATSNAGAEKIRIAASSGDSLQNYKEEFLNELLKSGEFKPEFLNRFDEICLFKPLSQDDCLKVLDLILAGVNKTLSAQKISIQLDDEAKQFLVERGYDPQLGARPMKRIVQKSVENIVAKFVLSGNLGSGMNIQISREMLEQELG